ncbi:MAG TPA: hypothetical protein VMW27_21875, partial [Thermoanaerobaculia bacterium]|nr:hypothetical protein [Thermoanaerobaculia bacterium]
MSTRPGVGLVVLGSPQTVFLAPNGTATYNDAAARQCFDPQDGHIIVPRDSDLFAAAFLGGDRQFANSRPQIGAEMQFMIGAAALIQAFTIGRPSFQGLPFEWDLTDDFNGEPTDFDMLKFCYIASPTHPFVAEMIGGTGDPKGKTPDNPFDARLDQRFPESERGDADRTRFQYFTGRNPVGNTVFWRYRTPDDRPTQEVFGYKRGYPEVFGPSVRPDGELEPLRRKNAELNRLLDEVEARTRAFRDGLPTSGGGKPLAALRERVRMALSEILGLLAPSKRPEVGTTLETLRQENAKLKLLLDEIGAKTRGFR